MIDGAAYLADAYVGIAAGIGAWLVLGRLDDLISPPELAQRLRFLLRVLAAMMFVRVGYWGLGGWFFTAVTFTLAALIPLAALLFAEGLLRRHAPQRLKQFVAIGTPLFILLALIPGYTALVIRTGGILLFQLGTIAWIAVFVLRRDQSCLSASENQRIDRIALSLLVILPLLATDFLRDELGDIPVRLGGVAVLALSWLALNLNRSGLRRRDIIGGFAAVGGATLAATLALVTIADLDGRAAMQVGVVVLVSILLLAIWQARMAFQVESRQSGALREIARAADPVTLIQQGSGAPDALVLEESDLAEVDLDLIRTTCADHPVLHISDIIDGVAGEQVDWLFARFEATHFVCLSTVPLRLVAMSNPALDQSDAARAEIAALQRVATYLDKQNS